VNAEIGKGGERLKAIKDQANAVSPEEKDAIMKARETNVREWRKRKRMAGDVMDAILENYPKSKKEFMEEVGCETDEDCGVSLPKIS